MIADPEAPTPQPPLPSMIRLLPLLPLAHTVLFPRTAATVLVTQPLARTALQAALQAGSTLVAVGLRASDDAWDEPRLYRIGVEAQVARVIELPDGTVSVLLFGLWRVELTEVALDDTQVLIGTVRLLTADPEPEAIRNLRPPLLKLLTEVVELSRTLSLRVVELAEATEDVGALIDLIATELPLVRTKRQEVLETLPVATRAELVMSLLHAELTALQAEQQRRTKARNGAQALDAVEHISSAAARALNADESEAPEIARLRTELDAAQLPSLVRIRADEELARLDMLPPGTPDYAVVRTYLHWLTSLPWQASELPDPDLIRAAQILDTYHYGLRKVKDRILEQLAVRKLAGASHQGPILCFVGPPGVGKTTLGQAIAAALQRPFVRVALGGVHDEAEIRGHRRTYVNALPGRIIKAMREAGTLNPVFMLDEIDKLGNDLRGDPTAALLEVLDPEQNRAFSDHYLDVPYDLSQVMFITTANSLEEVEDALVDRLEIIELTGYTEDEKVAIAQRFLVPRQIAANGLGPTPIKIPTVSLRQLTRTYTFEAGVRGLEREIGAICRKIARRIAEHRPYPKRIDARLLPELLGPERFEYGLRQAQDEIGVATGMVWTAHGGDVLLVEVSIVEGKGGLTLTGQLGEIMQESAQTALSFTRVNAKRLGIDPKRFEKIDVHIHLPEGGVPKDGPSAGITLVCGLVSALTGRALKRNVAMTGEMTLHGRVLSVGGIKEKVLGAYRAGISAVIVPAKNQHELREDLPRSVQQAVMCHYVSSIDEVFPLAFNESPLAHPWQPRKRKPRKSTAAVAETNDD